MAQLRAARAGGPGARGARLADRALPRRLHRRSSGASSSAGWSRASCSASSRRTRWSSASTSARWTRRSASRSRDRRLAAPDVGPRRAPRARAGGLRRGRGRARPVLLPPPGRVPRPAGGGGDPRPRQRADLRRARAVRRARGAARAADEATLGDELAAAPPSGSWRTGSCAGGPNGTYVPRARRRATRRARVSLRSAGRDGVAIVDVELGRDARHGRRRARVQHDARGRVYLHAGRSYEVAALDLEHAARSSSRSTATGTRSPSARPTRTSSGCSTAASCSA